MPTPEEGLTFSLTGVKYAHIYSDVRTPGDTSVYTLSAILRQLAKLTIGAGKGAPPVVHIFVDKLKLDSIDTSLYRQIQWLRVFAASVSVDFSNDTKNLIPSVDPEQDGPSDPKLTVVTPIVIALPAVWLFTIFAASVPDNVALRFKDGGKILTLVPDVSPAIGMHYFNDGTREEIKSIAAFEVARVNASDWSRDWYKRQFMIPVMLTRIFDRATQDKRFWLGARSGELPDHCISSFKLITMLTRGIEDQADLYAQADALLHRLRIPSRTSYFVPSRSPTLTDSVLKARTTSAASVEADLKAAGIKDLINSSAEKLSTEMTATASKIVKTITGIAQVSAKFEKDNAGEAYLEKQGAATKAMARFNELKDEMEKAGREFDKNYKTWKEEKERQAKWDTAMLCIELIVDVGLIFYSGPSALINSTTKLTKAAKTLKNSKKLLNGQDRWKRIGDLCGKLEKVHTVTGSIKDYGDKFFGPPSKEAKANTDELNKWSLKVADTMAKTDDQTDWGELKVMWDDFEIDNEEAFNQDLFKLDPAVDGTSEYHTAMKKFVARGRDVVAAQKDAQDFRKKLRQAVAFEKLLVERAKDYESQIQQASLEDKTKVQAAKYLLDEDLAAAKRWLFLAIQNWVLAFSYLNCIESLPDHKPPDITGSLSSVITAIAEFQEAIAKGTISNWQQADGTGTPKIDPVVVETDNTTIFQRDWRAQLDMLGELRFAVPLDSELGHPLSYVKTAMVSVEGLQAKAVATKSSSTSANGSVTGQAPRIAAFEVEFGPTVIQRGAGNKRMTFYSDALSQICEYNLSSKAVASSAVYQSTASADSRSSAVRPGLFSDGLLRLLPPAVDGFAWDVQQITKIILTLNVEFSNPAKKTETT